MTNYMSKGTKAVIKPPIITIPGFPGAGKSTLAGLFPSPAFIQAEDSQTVFEELPDDQQPFFMPSLPVAKKEKNISTKEVLLSQLREFLSEDHPYKTLVIDTVTSLNDMFEHELVEFDLPDVKSVQDAAGGFQKGYDVIAGWHQEIIGACNAIRNRKGMTIIFLAHTGDRKIKNSPELSGEYNVYGLKMHQKSEKIYVSLSDAVIYLKQVETAQGHATDNKGRTVKRGRIRMSEERVLITSSDGIVGYVSAKNRYDMPQEISVPKGTNPIMQYIPFYRDYVAQNGLLVPQEQEEDQQEEIKNEV